MKKFVIGIAVIGIYLIYSIGIRHTNPILPIPSSLANAKTKSSGSGSTTAAATSSSTTSGSSSSASGSSSAASSQSSSKPSSGKYKDGTYTGATENAYYGNVQVSVVVSGGRISDVKFLQYPNSHSTSVYINQQAMPYLKQETLQAQSANVQSITGATFTSYAFIQSLHSALAKA